MSKFVIGFGLLLILFFGGMTIQFYLVNGKLPKNLGVENGRLAPLPKTPNAVSTQTEDPEKHVVPLQFLGEKVNSIEKIKRAVTSYGGATIVKEEENYMHVVFTTAGMKFKDDVEFYADEAHQVIHYRSASRVGYSDMGLNRKRYDELSRLYYDQ